MSKQELVKTAKALVAGDKRSLARLRFGSRLPWALSFSFARAIQKPALETWRGEASNVPAAQSVLRHRARCNQAARRGEYDSKFERSGS